MAFSIGLALVSFVLSVAFGPAWLAFLRARRVGKQLNPSEPEENVVKEGTPTMGGVIFIVPVLIVGVAFLVFYRGRLLMLVPLLLALGCAILGALDDTQTLVGRARSAGLPPSVKWLGQIVLAVLASGALAYDGVTQAHVPFFGVYVLPPWVFVILGAAVLLSTINAVAITDGMDSLLGTTAALAMAAFWVVGIVLGYPLSAGLSAAVVGALLGYLWFNAHPAEVFMGDVGSLALGALLGMVALIEREPFLLIPIGIVFVAEASSTILQVLTNKLTSKRMFRITPLHHHFQRASKGDRWVNWPREAWPETRIVQRFWIVGAVGALVGLLAAVKG